MRVLPLPMMVSLPPLPVNSLKVPSEPGVGAGAAEAGGVVGVGEIGAAHGLDREQRVGADRGVAGHGAGGEVDGDARGRGRIAVVVGAVEAAAAVDGVVAGEAGEDLDGAEAVVAAEQRVGIGRTPAAVEPRRRRCRGRPRRRRRRFRPRCRRSRRRSR